MDWLTFLPEIFIAIGVATGIIARLARCYALGELDRKMVVQILGAALLSWMTALAIFGLIAIDPSNYRLLMFLGAVIGMSGDMLTKWLLDNGLRKVEAMIAAKGGAGESIPPPTPDDPKIEKSD